MVLLSKHFQSSLGKGLNNDDDDDDGDDDKLRVL